MQKTVSITVHSLNPLSQKDLAYLDATEYTLHGKNIVHLTRGSDFMHFFYDEQNKPAMVAYNGLLYSYAYNLQGDVIAMLNANGTVVVEYRYDAWGKPISKTGLMADTLGTLNPFRYRGYVYDEETGLYYLRSRYYNPIWGRFISADANLNSGYVLFPNNQFCYCINNPVMGVDYDGLDPWFGYYHMLVQEDFIVTHPGVKKEWGVYKYGDESRMGRVDLINPSSGEVWEVKPHMAGFLRNPFKYTDRALWQLQSYIDGQISNGDNRKELGDARLHPGEAVPRKSIYDALTAMNITYWSEGDGIIWYETSKPCAIRPAPVVVSEPERSGASNYSMQPSRDGSLVGVFALLLFGVSFALGYPAPNYAY